MLLTNRLLPRIEIGSCHVSIGEFESAKAICQWAADNGQLARIEILGFIDGGKSVEWVNKVGGKVINLLVKGSERHCNLQLGKTLEQHCADIVREVNLAHAKGLKVNLYLEDWSNGIRASKHYVYKLMDTLQHLPIERFMLAYTLGIMNPNQVYDYCKRMVNR